MKINWGTAIIIAFILFISFILFFVIKANTQSKYGYHLVSQEYYKDELNYQKEIDRYNNTKELGIELNFQKSTQGITISFPSNYQTEYIEGNVSLYRPSNQSLDKTMTFALSKSSTLLIPDQMLVDGRWDIKIFWKANNKEFLYKKEFIY